MKKEMICIGCPMGCYLTVDYVGTEINEVSGNRCKVGQQYAEKEISNPERTLTTTVKVTSEPGVGTSGSLVIDSMIRSGLETVHESEAMLLISSSSSTAPKPPSQSA